VTSRRRMQEHVLDAGPGVHTAAGAPALRDLARPSIEARDAGLPVSRSAPTRAQRTPDTFGQPGSRRAGLDAWAPSSSQSARPRGRVARAERPRLEDLVARLAAPDRRATRAGAALALVASGLEWSEVAALRVAAFLPKTSPASVIVLEQRAGATRSRGAGWYAPIGEELLAAIASWWALLPSRGAAFGGDSAKAGELRAEVLEVARSRGLAIDVVALERASRAARRLWRRQTGAGVVHVGSVPAQTTGPSAAAAERALYRGALAALEPTIARQAERVAALEVAERALRAQLAGDAPGRCGAWSSTKPCGGEVEARWCASCGEIVLRCGKHGGAAAAAVDLATRHAMPLGHLAAGVDVAALPALRAEARRLTETG